MNSKDTQPKKTPKQAIVIFGSLVSGIQTVHGPFEDKEHANQWASVHAGNQNHTIMEMEKF